MALATVLIIVALFLGVAFLPQITKRNNIDLSKPTPTNKFIIDLLNFRYKVIAILTFHRLQYSGTITSIHLHPIKSCSYLSVKSWEIDEIGLKYDRQYMIAFWNDKKLHYDAITLRNCPRLSLVKITYNLEENWFQFTYPTLVEGEFASFRLPCDVDEEFIKENLIGDDPEPTDLWGVKFKSVNIGKALPQKFLDSMGLADKPGITLLYTINGKLVKTYHPKALKKMRASQFHDYYPLHLLTQETIDDLNLRLRQQGYTRQITPAQFRPNLVISNTPKWINPDDWFQLKIKTADDNSIHSFSTAHRTPRCSIANVDLEKGNFDKTNCVSKILRSYRRIDLGGPSFEFLGHYAIQHESGYKITVGDDLFVTESRINTYRELE